MLLLLINFYVIYNSTVKLKYNWNKIAECEENFLEFLKNC